MQQAPAQFVNSVSAADTSVDVIANWSADSLASNSADNLGDSIAARNNVCSMVKDGASVSL